MPALRRSASRLLSGTKNPKPPDFRRYPSRRPIEISHIKNNLRQDDDKETNYGDIGLEYKNSISDNNLMMAMQSADVKKQTVFFLQTADVWSTSSAAEGCRCGPQTADALIQSISNLKSPGPVCAPGTPPSAFTENDIPTTLA
ncbi:hypothetical protein LXL04_009059 [Taraxacum kok-saghyz]